MKMRPSEDFCTENKGEGPQKNFKRTSLERRPLKGVLWKENIQKGLL